VWEFQREADGSLTDISSEARGPVPVADRERPEITVTGPERASTPDRPGTPLVIVRKGYDTAAEAEAPARVVAAEAPARATVTAPVSTGTERVTATTTERLTVSADSPTGEPVYVKTLPERHPVHPGKTVRDVFGHDGYWFTIPGDFPASLPNEFHLTRATYAVFQSPDVVPGALVWVARPTNGSVARLGQSVNSRREAVREALEVLSRCRMRRARLIIEDRAALNGRPKPAPVRVAAGDSGWVVHIRCVCEDVTCARTPPARSSPLPVSATRSPVPVAIGGTGAP